MDLGTIIGTVFGIAMMLWSILISTELSAFYDVPSIGIVVGGTIAAVLMSFPLPKAMLVMKVMKKTLMYPLPSVQSEIERMADFAYVARREGLLALEEKMKDIKDPFLVKGIRLVVDGFPAEQVKEILGIELFAMQSRHAIGKKLLDTIGALAPAFGMIGTLIGLIAMLKTLNDPSTIGASMAVALITTFYGAIIANMIMIPLSTKLEVRQKEETLMREVMIEGIAAIQAGDKPQMIKEKLKSFLSPAARASLDAKKDDKVPAKADAK